MTNGQTLRGWLLNQPRPVSLLLFCRGEKHAMAVGGPGQSWSSVAASVDAMEPELVHALDAAGAVIRACKPYEQEASEAAPAPATSSAPDDPETVRFKLFATLLAEAYRHSQEVAFTKLVEICNVLGKRGESLEKSLASAERMLRAAYREQLETEAALQEDPLTKMASAFMGGIENGQANGAAPNGAGKG